jgi:hypothetical protein
MVVTSSAAAPTSDHRDRGTTDHPLLGLLRLDIEGICLVRYLSGAGQPAGGDLVRSVDIIVDGFGRVQDVVHRVVGGLTPQELGFRVDGQANSIAWLVWHLARVQDDHVADAAQAEQVWVSGGWSKRFGLPFDRMATGYGQGFDDVSAVQVGSGDLLLGYHDAVHEQTVRYVKSLSDADLDRIVDTSWTPPVTLGVRLVSVLADDLQHAGQAALVRGVLQRR